MGVRDAECENVKLISPLERDVADHNKKKKALTVITVCFHCPKKTSLGGCWVAYSDVLFVWMGSHWNIKSCTAAPRWCSCPNWCHVRLSIMHVNSTSTHHLYSQFPSQGPWPRWSSLKYWHCAETGSKHIAWTTYHMHPPSAEGRLNREETLFSSFSRESLYGVRGSSCPYFSLYLWRKHCAPSCPCSRLSCHLDRHPAVPWHCQSWAPCAPKLPQLRAGGGEELSHFTQRCNPLGSRT